MESLLLGLLIVLAPPDTSDERRCRWQDDRPPWEEKHCPKEAGHARGERAGTNGSDKSKGTE